MPTPKLLSFDRTRDKVGQFSSNIPHIFSDSTLGWEFGPQNVKRPEPTDLMVEMESTQTGEQRSCRLLCHAAHSFAMSGPKCKDHQMKDWILSLNLGEFELVFVVPMRNSQGYALCRRRRAADLP